jgi:hypothetical protein
VPEEWDVRGQWSASQGNGWHVTFDIQQLPVDPHPNTTTPITKLLGSAEASHPSVGFRMRGRGSGEVTSGPGAPGHQFHFGVRWDGTPPINVSYNGTFGFDGRISGVNFRDDNPSVQTTWVSDKRFGKLGPPHPYLDPLFTEVLPWAGG